MIALLLCCVLFQLALWDIEWRKRKPGDLSVRAETALLFIAIGVVIVYGWIAP